MTSPFLELDDERRKRGQLLLSKLGQLGGSLVETPLTYEKLVNDAEDRRRKIEADKQKLMQEREQNTRENIRSEDLHKQSEFEMGTKTQEAKDKSHQGRIKDYVAGNLKNPNDEEVVNSAFNSPEFGEKGDIDAIQGELSRQRAAAALVANKDANAKTALGIKQQDADTRAKMANARLARGAAAASKIKLPRPQNLPAKQTEELANLETKYETLGEMQRYKDQENVDTGLLAGAMMKLRQLSHTQSPKEAILNTEMRTMLSEQLHDLSGATVTPQEYSRLQQLLPSQFDDEDVYNAITEVAMEMTEREHNNILHNFQKVGYHTGGLGDIGKPKEAGKATDIGSAIAQVRSAHPDWSKDQVKAEVRKMLGK